MALRLDGTPTWHWKPRATDTQDLDFGAAPNLFTITVNEESHDVVGEGAKDGTYYVLDRDGVNGVTGVRWDDNDPSALPYWRTNVVPCDSQGGIIAAAAVDEAARRIYFSTAPGLDLLNPQRLPSTRSPPTRARSCGKTPPSGTPTRASRPPAPSPAWYSSART